MVLRVQTKLLVLISVVVFCFIASLLVLQTSEQDRALLLLTSRQNEKQALVDELVRLRGASVLAFAYDYSFWDDMVSFIQTGDSAWAHDNIDVGLATFSSTAAWVFKPDKSLAYMVAGDDHPALANDPNIRAAITKRLNGTTFSHFFVAADAGVIEIRTAPVQPSNDIDRATPPLGFLAIGKVWDDTYLRELAQSASCEMKIALPSARNVTTSAPTSDTITFAKPIFGWNNAPIAYLQCTSTSPVYAELTRISKRQAIYLAVFALAVAGLLLASLSVWVGRPLKQISHSLRQGDIRPIEHLDTSTAEFAQIGRLMRDFIDQKHRLEKEFAERIRMAEALRESQRALETLMANLPGMAYRCKNDSEWTMDFVSEGCYDVTGYRASDIVGNTIVSYGKLIHDDDQRMVWDAVQAAIETRQPFRITYRIHDAQGHVRWVLEHGRGVFADSDELVAIEGFVLDITERIKAEEEKTGLQKRLDRAQRMESLAILAGGVAHDLNNLLGPVVGYPDLILMKLPDDSPVRHDVEMIARSAQQAVNVIQDLLSLARRGRYEMKPLDLNDVVDNYLRSASCIEQQERHRHVTLATRLDPTVAPILGSSTHLMKVIMNLVVNAFDAMHDGGTLTVATSQRCVSSLLGGYAHIEPGDYAILSIADTGSGIDPKDLPKIFEPYYSKKAMGKSGTGLGLAVVYGIVKDHGGYYDVFSKVGVGTEFVLYFPVTRELVKVEATTSGAYQGTETVLVVDDIPEQRLLARDILTAAGYQVATVASGHEALAHLRQNAADILVLDMIMEKDFDGLDTYREILKVKPAQKAIIVSGFSATDRIVEAQRLGAGQYVRKPYTRQSLCKAVREELDKTTNHVPAPV